MIRFLGKIIIVIALIIPLIAKAEISAVKVVNHSDLSNTLSQQKAQINAGCSAYANCVDGSKVTCSTTSSSASCQGVDQRCKRGGGSSGGWATCGWDEDHCNPNNCPPPKPPSCTKFEGWSCGKNIQCGEQGFCNRHTNKCECV